MSTALVPIAPTSLPPSVPIAAKCSPTQIQEMRLLAEIFIEMFLQLSPDQRKLYVTN